MVIPAIFILLIVGGVAVVLAKLYTSANRERNELQRENKSLVERYEPIVQREALELVKARFAEPEPEAKPEPDTSDEKRESIRASAIPDDEIFNEPEPEPEKPEPEPEVNKRSHHRKKKTAKAGKK